MNRCVDFKETNKPNGKWCCTQTKPNDQFKNMWAYCYATDAPKVEDLKAEVELDVKTQAFILDFYEKSNLSKFNFQWEGPNISKSIIKPEYFSACSNIIIDPSDSLEKYPKKYPKYNLGLDDPLDNTTRTTDLYQI